MDFTFTDEQNHLRKTVREFAEGEIAPHVMEWDEASHFPVEILPKLAEMGLMGIIFPEQYGGAGWVTLNTRPRSKNLRALMARLGCSSPRTIRFAPITSTNSLRKSKSANISCRWQKARSLAHGH